MDATPPKSFCTTVGDLLQSMRKRIDAAKLVLSGHRWTHGPGCECGYCKSYRAFGDDEPTATNTAPTPAFSGIPAAFYLGEGI